MADRVTLALSLRIPRLRFWVAIGLCHLIALFPLSVARRLNVADRLGEWVARGVVVRERRLGERTQ
ncbi:hypothetical protein T8T21_08520 [Limimaricola variabilis]|uniref:hypothetical protein n=1 Tax=Limimaricola variabilis TaxID=1492771 RepID=UPI002AC93B83|nr:hypothetical protein [Limimaricola variabilis]WPY93170.1 hypothetical protein T8T21_08520 [Limimaricola variabilis]